MSKTLWKNLGLALAGTPAVIFIALISFTLLDALIDFLGKAITKLGSEGYGWLLLIIAYVISLVYVLYGPKLKRDRERKKFVDALMLHWKFQLVKQGNSFPSDTEVEPIRDMLIERIKVWGWSNPQLWASHFPDEKYSEDPFEILGNLMSWWEEWKREYEKARTGNQ